MDETVVHLLSAFLAPGLLGSGLGLRWLYQRRNGNHNVTSGQFKGAMKEIDRRFEETNNKVGELSTTQTSITNISKGMWIAIGFIYSTWALYAPHVTFLITSGEDTAKGRKSNSKHKLNEYGECNAIDGSVRGLTSYQRKIILIYVRAHLDPRGYDTMIHRAKRSDGTYGVLHLHCEYDPKKGEVLIER